MAQSQPGPECQGSIKRPCSDMEGQHHVLTEEKQATTHDFLSIGGSSSVCATVALEKAAGLKAGITTQDLLQPLQTKQFTASFAVPAAFLIGDPKTHTSTGVCNAGGQQASINMINTAVEMQPNYTSLDISHTLKPHVPNDVVSLKHQQQQQSHLGFEALDGNKRLVRGLSDDDDDEDDDFLDHGSFSKKEIGFQKLDNVQHQQRQRLEGKSLDSKGLTSRSKHSATEQRRRSKINDRFQMLRQLLPNADQKRDKASFLLEVVEYIKMLHEKVGKYETTERLGQPLLWDRKSVCEEGLVNVSDGSPATIMTTYMPSPLRVGQENGKINSDGGQSSSFANRLLPAPICVPSYEDISIVSRPTFLSFAAPLSNSTEEPPTPTFSVSRSQSYPGGATRTSPQMRHEEEQAALGGKDSPARKEEAYAPLHLHQAGKALTSNMWRFPLEPNGEQYESSECTPSMLHDRGPNEAIDEQSKLCAKKEVSAMRPSRNVEDKLSLGLDIDVNGKLIHSNRTSLEGDCTKENIVDEKGPSTVLGGVVNISSPYSQGLLDTLTRALQTAGIDLAQASISVQVDLGKPCGSSLTSYKETATLNARILPEQSKSAIESKRPTKRPKVEWEG